MLKCEICGNEFKAIIERHYVCRNDGKVGVVATFQSNPEDTLYDAFDCPLCGCQHLVQIRKRAYRVPEISND